MIIKKIYETYIVPPHLQNHMYRVASIVQYIWERIWLQKKELHDVITVGLLHDIWNILKFDMSLYPDVREPEWVTYWTNIKEWYKKYGSDEKEATFWICKELNISQEAYDLVVLYDSTLPKNIAKTDNILLKLVDYADSRVMVYWISTIQERIEKLIRRNMKNKWRTREKAESMWQDRINNTSLFEQHLINQYWIDPQGITDTTMKPIIDKLSIYDIHTP